MLTMQLQIKKRVTNSYHTQAFECVKVFHLRNKSVTEIIAPQGLQSY